MKKNILVLFFILIGVETLLINIVKVNAGVANQVDNNVDQIVQEVDEWKDNNPGLKPNVDYSYIAMSLILMWILVK